MRNTNDIEEGYEEPILLGLPLCEKWTGAMAGVFCGIFIISVVIVPISFFTGWPRKVAT
jgi:hypothetical protein